jgi:hypothetical protein
VPGKGELGLILIEILIFTVDPAAGTMLAAALKRSSRALTGYHLTHLGFS